MQLKSCVSSLDMSIFSSQLANRLSKLRNPSNVPCKRQKLSAPNFSTDEPCGRASGPSGQRYHEGGCFVMKLKFVHKVFADSQEAITIFQDMKSMILANHKFSMTLTLEKAISWMTFRMWMWDLRLRTVSAVRFVLNLRKGSRLIFSTEEKHVGRISVRAEEMIHFTLSNVVLLDWERKTGIGHRPLLSALT